MNDFNTEEEQIAALKNWWKENGSSLLIGLGVALAVVFGWKAYQASVVQQKTEASLMYQQLVEAATQSSFDEPDDEATVTYLAKQLKTKFDDTEYALYAALFLAKESVAQDDLESAKAELNWVIATSDDSRIQQITKGRLARILAAEGNYEQAIALLEASDEAFKPGYLEILGDIHMRSGDKAAAIESYKKAYVLIKDQPQAQPLLAVKLSDLGILPDTL